MIRRLLALLLATGAIIGALFNPFTLPLKVGESSPELLVSAKARDLNLVCAGALFQSGGTSGTSLTATRLGAASLTGAFAGNGLTLAGGDAPPTRFIAPRNYVAVDESGTAEQSSALLNLLQSQAVAASNLGGLAAANCIRPSSDAWLVGGDTSPGRETLLLLTNATEVDSTVDLEILGPLGKISAPGLSSISVPAGKTTVTPVSALAPNLSTFSVHVMVRGGALGMWLQQRTMRSLKVGGVDLIAPSIDPAATVVIPGIFLRGTADAEKLISLAGSYSDLRPVLRLSNTTSSPASVTAQILGATASTYGTVIQQTVEAGTTIDVPITGLADGDYYAIINSSQPIRAAVRFARTKVQANDFAWASAADAFTAERGISAPAGSISKLALVNPNKKVAHVTLRSSTGSVTVNVGSQGTKSVVVPAGSVIYLSADAPISASEVIDVNGSVAVVAVIDYRNLGGKLAIRVR